MCILRKFGSYRSYGLGYTFEYIKPIKEQCNAIFLIIPETSYGAKEHVYQVSLRYLYFYSSYSLHGWRDGRKDRQSHRIVVLIIYIYT